MFRENVDYLHFVDTVARCIVYYHLIYLGPASQVTTGNEFDCLTLKRLYPWSSSCQISSSVLASFHPRPFVLLCSSGDRNYQPKDELAFSDHRRTHLS